MKAGCKRGLDVMRIPNGLSRRDSPFDSSRRPSASASKALSRSSDGLLSEQPPGKMFTSKEPFVESGNKNSEIAKKRTGNKK